MLSLLQRDPLAGRDRDDGATCLLNSLGRCVSQMDDRRLEISAAASLSVS